MTANTSAWVARRLLAVAVVLMGATSGCVAPSRTDADYDSMASNTAEVIRSSVLTVVVAIEVIEQGGAFNPYLGRVIGQAEEDAGSAGASFGVVQPPTAHADEVRDELDAISADAVDVLADARIAIRRDDQAAVLELRPRLLDLADSLQAFVDAHG